MVGGDDDFATHAYAASKGGIISFTRAVASYYAKHHIRANVIAPGFTLTEASYSQIENAKSYGVDRAALKRNAEVERHRRPRSSVRKLSTSWSATSRAMNASPIPRASMKVSLPPWAFLS